MLELRPNCENCSRDLPPDSTEAMWQITPSPNGALGDLLKESRKK